MSTTNPLLASLAKMPGSTFRLPSQGLFYDSGELDPSVKNGEVEVYPMTAIDEIILSTPDKLLSGKAITEVFARCVPQILNPDKLLAKDVDFLMICLRLASFGSTLEIDHKHNCTDAKKHQYRVVLDDMVKSTKSIDPTSLQREYVVTMPNGQVVALKPLTYSNVVQLYQTTALIKGTDLTQTEAEQLVVDTLASVIKSVDDVSDAAMIREWVLNVPLGWKKQLEKAAQHVSDWGIDLVHRDVCRDCGEVIEIPIAANPVSFFM